MKPNVLVTIPFSHYCEKARWALDRGGVAYEERGHLPLFAWIPALRAGRGRTVPSLITPQGSFADSTDILRWVDRMSGAPPLLDGGEVDALEDEYDRRLGPHTRLLAYSFLLPALRDRLDQAQGVPRAEIVAAKLLAPVVRMMMERLLRLDDAAVVRSRGKVDAIFDAVGARLADGRRYLCGDRFTGADLTFAALATPVILPPQLAGKIPMDDLPREMSQVIDLYRGTPAGKFALRLYAEDRGAVR